MVRRIRTDSKDFSGVYTNEHDKFSRLWESEKSGPNKYVIVEFKTNNRYEVIPATDFRFSRGTYNVTFTLPKKEKKTIDLKDVVNIIK